MRNLDQPEAIERLQSRILKCRKCPRLYVNPLPFPHALYCAYPKVLIVGRNPGLEHEYNDLGKDPVKYLNVYHQRFWDCNVGKYLRSRMTDHFFKNYVMFTNICKCSSPNNLPPTDREVRNCRTYLKRLIQIIKPEVIITLGAQPYEWFVPGSRLSAAFHIGPRPWRNITLYPLYHPSYLARRAWPELHDKQNAYLREVVWNVEDIPF